MVARRCGGVFRGVRVTRARWRVCAARMTAAGASQPGVAHRRRRRSWLPGEALVEFVGRGGLEQRIGGGIVLGAGGLPQGRTAGGRDPGWRDRLAEVGEDVAYRGRAGGEGDDAVRRETGKE